MSNRRLPRPAKIHSLKVVLEGTDPPVWRRLLVRSHSTLAQFHQVLQVTMGWEDCHLHQFRVGSVTYAPSQSDGFGPGHKEESRARLSAVALSGTRFVYEYDFGDGWEHIIEVERIVLASDGRVYPFCLDGARACPPEDCGGRWGYADLLDTLKSADSHRRDRLLESIGAEFDPDRFNRAAVNAALYSLGAGTTHILPNVTAMVTFRAGGRCAADEEPPTRPGGGRKEPAVDASEDPGRPGGGARGFHTDHHPAKATDDVCADRTLYVRPYEPRSRLEADEGRGPHPTRRRRLGFLLVRKS